jgi:DNA-binding PadR family transcriptional regulator
MPSESIGELEHLVLLTILNHPSEATALRLRETLADQAGRRITRGALYRSLDRLGEKGLITWQVDEPSEERGGHARRVYTVSHNGMEVLRHRREALERLWAGASEAFGR